MPAPADGVLGRLAKPDDSSHLVPEESLVLPAQPMPMPRPLVLSPDGRRGPWSGQAWDDIEVGDLIGQGGMGEVYRACQHSVGRVVALKVLGAGSADDAERRIRFANEARAAALIQHPNVVAVYASGEHAGRLYMVLEYLPGGTVGELIADRASTGGRFSPREAVEMVLQAARGLAAAQACSLVHRDLKPGNLLLAADGTVKVADFGLVRFLAGDGMTISGTVLGTPRYISPEQGRGLPAGAASDIYSLGAVFYELLTLRPPFDGATAEELIVQHNYREPVLPSQVNPDVPADVQAVCIACLRKDPQARFADAAALVVDLERLAAGLAPLSVMFPPGRISTGAEEALRRLAGRRRIWPLLAVAALVLALAGGWWWWDARKATEATLRQRLAPLAAAVAVPTTAATDLAALAALVGTEDAQVVHGRGRLDEVASLRQRLADRLDRPGVERLDLPAVGAELTRLRLLVPEEPRLIAWSDRVATETAAIAAYRATVASHAASGGPLPHASRTALGAALGGLAARGIPADAAARTAAERLAEAARSEAELSARLAASDGRRPQAGEVADLDRLAALVGEDDPRVLGRRDRQRRVAELSLRLGVAGDAVAPPGAAADLRALAGLVGPQDAQVEAWTARLATGDRLRAGLAAAFDAQAPVPAAAVAELAAFAQLVGAADPDLRRWQARLTAWAEVSRELDRLETVWVLDPAALAAAEAALERAQTMAGPMLQWRRRLDELAGPPRPAWAVDAGRDQMGPWLQVTVGAASQRLRWLPSGNLVLGSPPDEAGRDPDEAQVRVRLTTGCWIADSECCRSLWQAVMGGPAPEVEAGLLPVVEVAADEAEAFCTALARLLPGCRALLPSEAVWEAAARAGSGEAWGGLAAVQAPAAIVHDTRAPQPVGSGVRNPLGLAHMLGNVREWCRDGYGPLPVGDLVVDPCAPSGGRRVVRGGSWGERLAACRAANRTGLDPGLRSAYLGFRFTVLP